MPGFWDDIVPKVDPDVCRQCADCAPTATCPANAFRRLAEDAVPTVNADFCFGCYSCAGACNYGAIILPRRR